MPRITELEIREIRKVSVICPFYNEEMIIKNAIEIMVKHLERSGLDWELVLVNDGSTDRSLEILTGLTNNNNRVKIISYGINQGRGYALKMGINYAQGDVIITTEIDLSWGEDIIAKIVSKFKEIPKLDVVIASPNLPGGGYKNVPWKRIFISRLGNQIIRFLFTRKITMNTGMTRGYRREVIQKLYTDEKGKEFNLEVLLKLDALGFRIAEIPAILEWREHKFLSDNKQKRKSSSHISKLITSHLNFAVFANPIRYFWFFAFVCFLASLGFISVAIYRFFSGKVAIFIGLIGLFLGIFSLLFFGFGILTAQNKKILLELWRIKINDQ